MSFGLGLTVAQALHSFLPQPKAGIVPISRFELRSFGRRNLDTSKESLPSSTLTNLVALLTRFRLDSLIRDYDEEADVLQCMACELDVKLTDYDRKLIQAFTKSSLEMIESLELGDLISAEVASERRSEIIGFHISPRLVLFEQALVMIYAGNAEPNRYITAELVSSMLLTKRKMPQDFRLVIVNPRRLESHLLEKQQISLNEVSRLHSHLRL